MKIFNKKKSKKEIYRDAINKTTVYNNSSLVGYEDNSEDEIEIEKSIVNAKPINTEFKELILNA